MIFGLIVYGVIFYFSWKLFKFVRKVDRQEKGTHDDVIRVLGRRTHKELVDLAARIRKLYD